MAVPGADQMVALLKMPMRLRTEQEDDRRVFPRKQCHATVESRRVDHRVAALRSPDLTLALRDLSLGGLSAIVQTPVEQGERLRVHFPQQGELREWTALGRVLRCAPSGIGYRVAVEFDPIPMAA